MKRSIIALACVAVLCFAGCGQQKNSTVNASSTKPETKSSTPVTQPVLTAWNGGDKAGAVTNFVAANWSSGRLFPASSPLSLSEAEFQNLSRKDREEKSQELNSQASVLKQLAQAVAESGREAAARGDKIHAEKCFSSLKQFGNALNQPASLQILQLVGKAVEKMADVE